MIRNDITLCRRFIARRCLHQEDQSCATCPLAWCVMSAAVGLVTTRPSSTQSESSSCLMEAGGHGVHTPRRIKRRTRPPEFGAAIPTITGAPRGMAKNSRRSNNYSTTTSTAVVEVEEDKSNNCPMCKKFSRGPCGNIFQRWLVCTDCHTGKVNSSTGEPLHLSKCADFAVELAECLEENTDYYTKDENEEEIVDDGQQLLQDSSELKNAWTVFVTDMEDSIRSGKYTVRPFPAALDPKIKIRANTTTGAAFFMSLENENDEQQQPQQQQPLLVAAYILDDNSNVIAAGSQEDMYMDDDLGCVLQFKTSIGMKSVTARAIYDDTTANDDDDGILIYSRTMLVPIINK